MQTLNTMMLRPFILPLFAVALIAGCDQAEPPPAATTDTGKAATPAGAALTPLTSTALRFDGAYRHTQGNMHNILRFFPEGNVVLITGTDTTTLQRRLRARLLQDTPTNGALGLHNVPVLQRNDSLLFVTRPMKGEIDYSGVVLGPDSIRFLKHSHINGKRAILTYLFEADPAS